jgi:hypothetical protein
MGNTMTTAEAPANACPFAWCSDVHPGHREHAWTDGVPAKVKGNPGRVYTYAVLYDGDQFNDEILIGIQRDDDENSGSEGWLTIEEAETVA